MQRLKKGIVVGLILGCATGAMAQPRPAAPAPAAPTAGTDTALPKRITLPPNFQKVTEGRFTVICEPNEAAWVKTALIAAEPKAKKPEGGPADMITNLKEKRATLVKQISEDLGLANDKSVNDMLDTKVIPGLQKLDTIKVPMYYMVTSQDRLKMIVKDGWNYNEHFHYNRLADAVAINESLTLSTEKPMDDQIRVLYFDPKVNDPKKNAEGLTNLIVAQDGQIAMGIGQQAFPMTFKVISDWIDETIFKAFNLPRNQKWIQLGIPAYLTTKYAASITGLPRDKYLAEFFQEKEDVPVSANSIDLTKPIEEKDLNPAMKPFYDMAMLRKSVIIVKALVDQSSDTAIGKIIAALRKGAPADDAGLVKTIKEATGVDLGPKK